MALRRPAAFPSRKKPTATLLALLQKGPSALFILSKTYCDCRACIDEHDGPDVHF
jgi:hypothetical protein